MLCGPSQIITLPIGVPLFEEWDGGRQLTMRWRWWSFCSRFPATPIRVA
jgi:hypothetical protein